MVGPVAQLHIGDRFMFKGKILGGLLYGKTPYQLYKPDYFGVVAPWSEITSAKDWKFSWQAGMGITYQLSCVAFVFETEIIHDQLEFNFYKGSTLHTEYKDISIINTTLGIHLLF
jgi:opacity protein-like surface antigen